MADISIDCRIIRNNGFLINENINIDRNKRSLLENVFNKYEDRFR